MTQKLLLGIALMLILIIPTTSLRAQAVPTPSDPVDDEKFTINGAGSSFVFPLMDTWRVKYHGAFPQIALNYQSIGSGAGIYQFTKTIVDFGATDAPLQPSDQKAAPGALTFPESIGAVVIAYNLNEVPNSGLKLTGPIIANIYMGNIKYWNDPQIQKLNPGFYLPNHLITTIHRADASGTTYAFTSYLSKVSPAWKSQIGAAKSVPWPVGIGIANNGGVANTIINSPSSIGYVELAYAVRNNMTYAYVQNADGTNFVAPTLASTAAAASSIKSLPESKGDWSKVAIVNAPGKNSYPICTFTYLVVYSQIDKVKNMSTDKAQALVSMIFWMVTDGQKYASKLLYVPLPTAVQEIDKRGLAQITFGGSQIFDYTTS